MSDERGHTSWPDLVEFAPVPTLLVEPIPSAGATWRICRANESARSLLAPTGARDDSLAHRPLAEVLHFGDADPAHPSSTPAVMAVTLHDGTPMTLHWRLLPSGDAIAQLTATDGRAAVEHVLDEQQKFRGALLELSRLAHTTTDDSVFYQRLIERAVDVVPGAQGGSVQLNVPGTTTYRFVAALGYDLAGLQRHVLDKEHFFRDTVNPEAEIVHEFAVDARTSEIAHWLNTVGRLDEIKVNVSAPVIADGIPVAFLALDNFESTDAMGDTTIEMTTVLAQMIGELWRRRELEAEVRKEREAFRELAMHDPLTGLANRRNLERSLEDSMTAASIRSEPKAVLFVDIDDFKRVNDHHGHKIGDNLLIAVGDGLTRAVRGSDTVGRWGGDEFLVVPARIDSVDGVRRLSERIIEHFDQPVDLGQGVTHHIQVTVGIGWSASGRTDAERLMRAADEALYDAKAAGKGVASLREV